MTPAEARVGARVTWAERWELYFGDDPRRSGTVVAPEFRDRPVHPDYVFVHWDRDELDIWALQRLDDLRLLPDEAQPRTEEP